MLSVAAYAQGGLGTVQGTVVDSQDAAVPGAAVKLVQTTTNIERSATTNEEGFFILPSLVASSYSLTITAPGFKTRTIANLTLNSFQVLALGRIGLEVGDGPATQLTVTSEQMIVTENAVQYDTIQSKQVVEMPLNGRNWSTLLKVIPGSSPLNNNAVNGREASYDGYADFRVNGKRANQTQANLDGGSVVDHGNDGKTTVTPSLESIQEVSTLTNNFQAEYGLRSGLVINIVTKSGTNRYNFTVWDYLRNEALNSNTWSNNYFGVAKPRTRYNYFGANAGGPIVKDKLFFFYNYENLKQDTPTTQIQVRVPTVLERNGDFSQTINANGTRPNIFAPGSQAAGRPVPVPNNVVPASQVDPLGKAILALYPTPNLLNETNNNYLLQYQRKFPRFLNVGKVDWNISDKTRAYVRYSEDGGLQEDNIGWTATGNVPFAITRLKRPDRALAVNVTRTFSPTLVSENLFSWSYDFPHSTIDDSLFPDQIDRRKVGLANLPSFFETEYGFVLPQVASTGYPDFNFNRFPVFARANEWQGSSTWTWTKGSHVIKWGGTYIRNTKAEIDGSTEKGVFNFGVNTASDFDTGYAPANTVTGALNQFSQRAAISQKQSLYQDFHFFIQDTWKVTSKFTLDYGLRLQYMPTEYNTNPDLTLDAVFLFDKWDPAKAPRYYVPNPSNPNQVIDPANPNNPVPQNLANVLRYSIVPNSGDLFNGVVPLRGEPGLRNPPLMFAPRGGFAWQALPKTVIRAGFGWAYNRVQIGQAVNNFENALSDLVDLRQTSIATLNASRGGVRRLSPFSFGVRDPNNRLPVVYDYSFSIQREVPWGMVLEVAYIGNIQRRQNITFNVNNPIPGSGFDPRFRDPRLAGNNLAGPISASNPGPLPGTQLVDINLLRPYVGLGSLNLTANVGNATYNSIQTQLQKRFGQGLTFQVAHTMGYVRGNTESFGHYFLNWRDYGGYLLDNDRRHVVAINYTYDVPKVAARMGFTDNAVGRAVLDNWSVAHLLNFYSGRRITPTFSIEEANTTNGVSNLNNIFTGSSAYAPRILPTSNPNTGGGPIDAYFNNAAFTVPGLNIGTGSRNFLVTPGMHSNDINVSKRFPIGERRNLEIRASLFNPFNAVRRDNFANTNAVYKANGATAASGFRLWNSPEQLVTNLVNRNPNATAAERYNQYRAGFGHINLTDVQPMRTIEIGLRLRF